MKSRSRDGLYNAVLGRLGLEKIW